MAGAPPCPSPKTLSCKGKEVENVFTIRTPEDANRVGRLARGRNVVVVGAGFLGEQLGASHHGWQWCVCGGLKCRMPACHHHLLQAWRWQPT